MSNNERHRRSKRSKTLCAACQERKARFKYRGEVRADRDHNLCFECYRGETNRARARRLWVGYRSQTSGSLPRMRVIGFDGANGESRIGSDWVNTEANAAAC
jgi:hypothetical protein